jgi:hypothetical protein
LRIVGSQIKTEIIFSLARILANLRRFKLQLEILEILIFVSKNWPNDLRTGCKSPFSSVEFIGIDGHLEEELEKFESYFERDEVVDLWS